MESAIVLNAEDIKRIIAEKFGVDESKVIKSQYTYTVIGARCESILSFSQEK